MVGLAHCLVHCQLVRTVFATHYEVLFFQLGFFIGNFLNYMIKFFCFFKCQEDVLAVSNNFLKLLNYQMSILQKILAFMVFILFILEHLFNIQQFLSHLLIFREYHFILFVYCSFLPSRKHNQIVKFADSLLVFRLRGEISHSVN